MLGEETKSRTEQVRTLGTEKLMITKSRQLKKKENANVYIPNFSLRNIVKDKKKSKRSSASIYHQFLTSISPKTKFMKIHFLFHASGFNKSVNFHSSYQSIEQCSHKILIVNFQIGGNKSLESHYSKHTVSSLTFLTSIFHNFPTNHDIHRQSHANERIHAKERIKRMRKFKIEGLISYLRSLKGSAKERSAFGRSLIAET